MSVIPIQLSQLNNSPDITWASISFIAVDDEPSAPINGLSASIIMSFTLLVSFFILYLIVSSMLCLHPSSLT